MVIFVTIIVAFYSIHYFLLNFWKTFSIEFYWLCIFHEWYGHSPIHPTYQQVDRCLNGPPPLRMTSASARSFPSFYSKCKAHLSACQLNFLPPDCIVKILFFVFCLFFISWLICILHILHQHLKYVVWLWSSPSLERAKLPLYRLRPYASQTPLQSVLNLCTLLTFPDLPEAFC